ncbi:magnesium transporter [Parvularcula dongshanensis]|uniref:Magnesium transporter MgtE n=1 Tax=Parvularcula dongshanensis TaxID=1173995 RepID=A0A840I681_9PROT|nr:magnesium transporter [Parvularcula dongshanensis]MBB4659763.1 magnesium transporter [Parvularcula dongshanensis]
MTDEPDTRLVPGDDASADAPAEEAVVEEAPLDERMSLNPDFVRAVDDAVEVEDAAEVRRLTAELHPADVADLMEQMQEGHRGGLFTLLGDAFDAETLVELDEDVRDALVEAIPNDQLALAVAELDTDDAAFVIENLDEDDRAEVLAEMPVRDRLALQAAFDYPDDSAGRMMQREVFAAPAFRTVGEIIDRLRGQDDLPERFYEIYVVDPTFRVVGVVPLSRFLKAPRDTVIETLILEDHPLVRDLMDQEEVAYLFEKYNLISAPVVDESQRLVGMITVDDVVEIVHEERDEDMLALAGVDREEGGLSIPVRQVARSRFTWLSVNLLTAILASFIIGLFDATIAQAVALAVLMPIVASMGGNAGTQTLTVAVRNLATRNLTGANAIRVVTRETIVALINGIAFAILLGVAAGFWYDLAGYGEAGDGLILGCVLAAAMIITMVCAGLAGTLVPLGLQKAGADPAVSSAVFVTTVTDVVGFFAFLGLAAVFLVGR